MIIIDLIFNLIIDLIIDGTVAASQNKKVPKFIRYILIFLIVLFSIVVIGSIIGFGIYMLKDNMLVGITVIIIGILSAITCILKLIKTYKNKTK